MIYECNFELGEEVYFLTNTECKTYYVKKEMLQVLNLLINIFLLIVIIMGVILMMFGKQKKKY